jgi:hemolysin III
VRITLVKPKREQSRSEEIANSVSHGVGLVAALLATPPLLIQAAQRGDGEFIIGASIFAASMVLLYLASALYHALPPSKTKQIFRVIEHSTIFLLIAGTYTPFTLGVLRGAWGRTLLIIIWALAVGGVVMKMLARMSHPIVSTGLYLLMGWLIVVAVEPLSARGVPTSGLLLLLAGGLAYTIGVTFYALDARLRYGHFIWHLFVMTGTACHYYAVLWYAFPV